MRTVHRRSVVRARSRPECRDRGRGRSWWQRCARVLQLLDGGIGDLDGPAGCLQVGAADSKLTGLPALTGEAEEPDVAAVDDLVALGRGLPPCAGKVRPAASRAADLDADVVLTGVLDRDTSNGGRLDTVAGVSLNGQ